MQVHTSAITLESFASLVENGVNHGVFVGDAESPVDSTSTWEAMVDELIDMYSIPGNNAVPLDSIDELMRHVAGLQHAIDYFHTKMQTVRVFDREAWLEANDGTFNQTNREDFYKEFKL
jgi:hypothetical protein